MQEAFFLYAKHVYDQQLDHITQKTKEYLKKEKQVEPSDIKEIQGAGSKGGDYGISVKVIFRNEPNKIYFYRSIDGEITEDPVAEEYDKPATLN
ncbi:hypothetical protein [Ornithinibacillus sp. FSL M8-0202]|uniref:hypothetical protein n=1 Tax=unclassified Ornithinibacillus TaxID=2620869 RepID=UPI0030CDB705